jgi:hypothetical protein
MDGIKAFERICSGVSLNEGERIVLLMNYVHAHDLVKARPAVAHRCAAGPAE